MRTGIKKRDSTFPFNTNNCLPSYELSSQREGKEVGNGEAKRDLMH
jgi:hypothetical protein